MLGALSVKARDGELFGLDAYTAEAPKTGPVYKTLGAIGLQTKKTLVVMPEHNEVLVKSLKNIPQVSSTTADKLNAYELLTHRNVLFVGDAVQSLEQRVLSYN
ncbi:MAG: 50S ribosomal protein L4 [Candidatus Peribacteria bacterium]|nr:MAG: 50S ribosomal protein L4 [Candidatus Peribacteria bacterium]